MSRLFQPLRLRELSLSNRIVVSPMCQYSAVDGNARHWHEVHLGQLALASAGMLIIEATAVEDIGRITPACLGLYNRDNEQSFKRLLDNLRALNPAIEMPICLQLSHAGRKTSSREPWNTGQQIPLDQGGWLGVAPSAIAHKEGEQPPLAMDKAQMMALKERFVDACRRAAELGMDAVELHCAHGYLMHQFLSPLANQRDDEYGGTLENRMRYPLEVFQAMRHVWPEGKPMGVRLSASDWDTASSWNIREATEFSQALEELGCDWIDVSSGGVSSQQKIEIKPGYQVHFASEIRAHVDIPVMAVGLITDPHQAEQILADGQADLIALARAFLYEPRWVWHAAAALGDTTTAPPQYWRCAPAEAGRLFGDTPIGQR